MPFFYHFCYSIFLRLYYCTAYVLSFFQKKAYLWIDGRRELTSLLSNRDLTGCLWFHASSLGEFEQVSFVIEKIKETYPHEKILVSFFSPSGYEMRKNFKYADAVIYLPFDFKKDVRQFLEIIRPKIVIWVRYEFWYHTLSEIKKRGIPLYLLNGVFRDRVSCLYRPILIRSLSCFSKIFVINEASKSIVAKFGYSAILLPDTRYDRVHSISNKPFEDSIISDFCSGDLKVVVCGSTWPRDEFYIKEVISSDTKWIIVPHEINQRHLDFIAKLFPRSQRYTQYQKNSPSNILIIDTIGLLSRVYRYADLVYVGGGFNKVVHSLSEPLVYGHPIIIGRNIEKSEEAKTYLALSLIYQIHSPAEFRKRVESLLVEKGDSDREKREHYFQSQLGSTDKLMNLIVNNLHF